MLDDFRLRIFKTLAREGSFTKAASKLQISQPAVSQNIAELEKMLSQTLFERQRGAVLLTKEGEIFMKYADKILESYEEADSAFTAIAPTTVSIAASEELYSYIIAPALQDFISIHPEVSFERCMTEAPDLKLTMQPSSLRPFDLPAESIIRLKWTMSEAPHLDVGVQKTTGDLSVTREKSMYFDILFQPSPVFGCTLLCRILKEFLTRF